MIGSRRRARLLLARRAGRPQPARDDKALAAWNGLAIAAFADAARALGRRASRPDGAAATGRGRSGGRDHRRRAARASRLPAALVEGRASHGDGVPEDYTDLAEGLLALYEATFDERWFMTARG